MIQLAHVVRVRWHAVERDLLSMGYHADEIGTRLTLWELISIVVASHPNTAVHYWMGGWSREADMLAGLSEQHAGLLGLSGRYPRPGVDSTPVKPLTEFDMAAPYKGIMLEAVSVDEFTPRLKERQRLAREGGSSDTKG
jgi:hypothetical protein